jgi:hypothetical protein
MNAIEPMSMERYLRTSFEGDRDYIDGAARERNIGFRPHSVLLVIVGTMLDRVARANGFVTLMSVRMKVNDETIMVSDLTVIPRSQRDEDILVTAPVLCVEIEDARDTKAGLLERVAAYTAMGVKNNWIISADGSKGYYASASGYEESSDGLLRVEGTAIEISLPDVLTELSED